MAKVKFNFDVDGIYQELRYYRSSTPMDISSMPAPIKSGFTEKEVTDDTAPDTSFYSRFSAVRDGVEYISEEVFILITTGEVILKFESYTRPSGDSTDLVFIA